MYLDAAFATQIILKFYLFVFQALGRIQVLFFVLGRFMALILQYKKGKPLWRRFFSLTGG